MRILFLDAYFKPEQIAFTHLENDLLEGLVEAGHEVEVVCPIPTRGISVELAKDYKSRKSETLYNGHVHVTRFSAPQERKNPLIRALRYFWCNLRTYQIGTKIKCVDVVFANSTPPTQGWIAGIVAKKQKVPFVFSLQDIFPDSLVNAGMTKKGSITWKIGRKIEKRTYDNANKVITLSEAFKDNIAKKGVEPQKVVVIPNWIDTSEVFDVPKSENKIIKKFNLDSNKFFICYSGNIGHSQNIEHLIEVAKKIQEKTDQIEFVIIGEGVAKDQLKTMVENIGIRNVHIIPFQPYEDIAHVFSLGDAGLIISKPGIGGSSVPSKTWSIMAAGRPILASFDANSELVHLISTTNSGVFADANDVEGFVENLMRLYSDKASRESMGNNGQEYVNENLSKEICVQKYIDIFVEMVD